MVLGAILEISRVSSCPDHSAQTTVSVVVPVYNGCETLAELNRRLQAVLTETARRFEIILVNDGSRDKSWQAICEIAATFPNMYGIDLMRNYGQHNALLAGIRQAQHEIIVTLDDDLQNPPEEIPRLLDKLDEGFDVVYGTPIKQQHGVWRGVASYVTKLALQATMGATTARSVSAFRVFRTDLRRAFADYGSSFVSVDVLLTWGTTSFTSVPVGHDSRHIGQSNYTFRKLMIHALNMITGFNIWPLQVASLIGLAFTVVGVSAFLFVILSYLAVGDSVPGFPFLASLIAILGGAQLFALGIIGEYLARMHFRTMGRPLYTIGTHVGRVRSVAAQEPSSFQVLPLDARDRGKDE